MSWLSSGLKKVGSVAKKAAPIALPLAVGLATGGIGGGLVGGALKKVGGKGLGGAIGKFGGGILGGLKKIGIDGALGGASLAMGAYQQKKAGDLRGKALGLAEKRYAEQAGLRKMGMQGLMNEQRPDLSGVFQSQNPFMRRVS